MVMKLNKSFITLDSLYNHFDLGYQ
jgi:hypothetical protein